MELFEDLMYELGLPMVSVGVFLVVYLVFLALLLAYAIAVYILMGIPVYRMAKKQGAAHAWLAFLPWGHEYMLLKAGEGQPFRVFGKRLFKKRTMAFWTYLAVSLSVSFVLGILSGISGVMTGSMGGIMEGMGADGAVMGLAVSGVSLVFSFITMLVGWAVNLIGALYTWRCLYDIFTLFTPEKNAMAHSVVATLLNHLLPFIGQIVYIVLLWQASKREPVLPAAEVPAEG